MVRSFTARLGRPLFVPAPRRRAGRRDRSTVDLVWRPFEAAGGLARSASQVILRHRRLRVVLLAVLVALPLLAGGWLLLAKSSFVRVEHVKVSGVHGPQAHAIEVALSSAASNMSTLDIHSAALRAAVTSFPVVQTVRAIPSFPHGLRIEVIEQPPVAALTIAGERTAVAADGVVLGPALLSGSLPALSAPQSATAEIGQQPGRQRVQGQSLLAELTVLGAAPRALERFAARVYTSSGGQGLTVAMRGGLLVYFGDAWRPHAKWTALARVLADPTSAGASYIDVRVPERPAAGFPPGGASSESTTTSGQASTPESTVAALAAKLTAGTNGEPAAVAASTTPTTEASTEPEATSQAAPEAESSSGSGDSASTGESESTTPGG